LELVLFIGLERSGRGNDLNPKILPIL